MSRPSQAHQSSASTTSQTAAEPNVSALDRSTQLRTYVATDQRDERVAQGIHSTTRPDMAEYLNTWDETWNNAAPGQE
ncbi:hypothetical protein MN608_11905 [Microdochium nivale]|nr:hypothetical protein MN608_11905 [Microdochium nivale]